MKVGINLLLWTARATADLRPELAAIRAAGADGVEVPVMEGPVAEYRALAGLLDDLGLQRTASMAFVDPAADPSSADAAVRAAALDELRRQIDRCHAVGATFLCGPMYQVLGQFTGQAPTEAERRRAADLLRAAVPAAAAAGVTLAVEPLNRFECHLFNTLADAAALVRAVNHPSVGVLFDTFHANIEEKDPPAAIRRDDDVIRHVHISASDRGIPGEDHIDWPATFASLRAINYDGWCVIEAFGRALPTLAAATRIWRDLFPDATRAAEQAIAFVRSQVG